MALVAGGKTIVGLAMWPMADIGFYGTVHSVTPAVFQAITACVLLFGAYCSWRVGGAADYSALFALMSTFFVGHFIEAYTGGYDFNVEYFVVPVLTVCAILNPVPMKPNFGNALMYGVAGGATLEAIYGIAVPQYTSWRLPLVILAVVSLVVFIYRSCTVPYNVTSEPRKYYFIKRYCIGMDTQSKWWAIGTLPFLLVCASVMLIPPLQPLASSKLLFIPTTLWLSLSTVGVITRRVREKI